MEDVFRKKYTDLTEEQKGDMIDVKIQAQNLLDRLNQAIPADERSERSRCMAIARTNLEQAIMWAVKGITTSAA